MIARVRRAKRLLEVDLVEDAGRDKAASSVRCCLFCTRQAGSLDTGAPDGRARIVLTDGIDDACFVVWVLLFKKKFKASDRRCTCVLT